MKAVLINPPQRQPKKWGLPAVFQPLGLMYLASALKSCGWTVNVIDALASKQASVVEDNGMVYYGLSFGDIKKTVRLLQPDLIGVSAVFSVNSQTVKELVCMLKEAFPTVKVVVGGPDASVRPLFFSFADHVVVGEGEKAICNLSSKWVEHPYTVDLDELAFPCREVFPMQNYFDAYKMRRASRQSYIYSGKWATMITTRGCPFNCVFCSIHLSMGKCLRKRSVSNILGEIEGLVKGKLGVKHINFEDDNISLDQKRFKALLEGIVSGGFDFSWSLPNGVRADTLNEEIIALMSKSGCKRVFVAPESGVQRVVDDVIHKELDLKAVEKAVVLFRKYGIVVDAAFILGLIGETKKDIYATIKYAKKLREMGAAHSGFGIAAPLFGTELYNQAVFGGYISVLDAAKCSPFDAVINTEEWSAKWLLQMRDFAYLYANHGFNAKVRYLARQTLKRDWRGAFGFIKDSCQMVKYLGERAFDA